jgi:hypothetical protein
MKLLDLIQAVKEKDLDREQLEDYHSQISSLFAQMQLEMADLEKEEALFMGDYTRPLTSNGKDSRMSVAQAKVEWKVTQSGQRLIVLKRYQLACKELLNSLKSRIYKLL